MAATAATVRMFLIAKLLSARMRPDEHRYGERPRDEAVDVRKPDLREIMSDQA
jgi:hypothetical protein